MSVNLWILAWIYSYLFVIFFPIKALLVPLECVWLTVNDGSGSSQSCSVVGWALLKNSMWRKNKLHQVHEEKDTPDAP